MSAAPQRPTAGIGQVIAGRYRVMKRLGAGGMGAVFEALDLETRERVAVKVLRRELRQSERALRRFRREGEILAGIRHSCVVRVYGAGELADGSLFIAMELIRGETLRVRMRRGPMTPWELTPIVRDIVDGLSELHARGIVHRDLKPNNILLERDRRAERRGMTMTHERAKLVDFGVARAHWRTRLTGEGQVVGTLRCMAPEQLRAQPDVDQRVDVYALGVMLYEAIVGEHPFGGRGDAIVQHVLDGRFAHPSTGWPGIDGVILRAMSARREERHASAQELAADFAAAAFEASGPKRSAPRSSIWDRPTREAHYEAPTVRARRDVHMEVESGTRRVQARTLGQVRAQAKPSTRLGHPAQRQQEGTPTAFGVAPKVAAPPAVAPYEVIPTVTYTGMPLSDPTARTTVKPRPTAPRRSRRVLWAAIALALGMLVGSGLTAWALHAQ